MLTRLLTPARLESDPLGLKVPLSSLCGVRADPPGRPVWPHDDGEPAGVLLLAWVQLASTRADCCAVSRLQPAQPPHLPHACSARAAVPGYGLDHGRSQGYEHGVLVIPAQGGLAQVNHTQLPGTQSVWHVACGSRGSEAATVAAGSSGWSCSTSLRSGISSRATTAWCWPPTTPVCRPVELLAAPAWVGFSQPGLSQRGLPQRHGLRVSDL